MAMNVELRGCGREGDKVTPEHLPFTIHRNGVVDMQRWDNELSRGGAIHHYFRQRPLRDRAMFGRQRRVSGPFVRLTSGRDLTCLGWRCSVQTRRRRSSRPRRAASRPRRNSLRCAGRSSTGASSRGARSPSRRALVRALPLRHQLVVPLQLRPQCARRLCGAGGGGEGGRR